MRIAFVSPAAGLGGGERSLLDILKVLASNCEYELHVVLFEKGPLIEEIKSIPNVQLALVPLPNALQKKGESSTFFDLILQAPAVLRFIRNVHQYFLSLDPDIIHSNGNKAHIVTALAKTRKAKLIWHVRDFISFRAKTKLILTNLAFRTDLIIANSKTVLDDLEKHIKTRPLTTLYNAVDPAIYKPCHTPKKIVQRYALIATYARWKGHIFFLETIQHMNEYAQQHDLKFLIWGGPIYKTDRAQLTTDELTREIRHRNLQHLVQINHFVSNPVTIYNSTDAVVNTSTRPEPFGRTIIEAMAAKKLVIAPNEGGPTEIVKHRKNGLLFSARNCESLAKTIKNSHEDCKLSTTLIDEAFKWIHENTTYHQLSQQLQRIYSNL